MSSSETEMLPLLPLKVEESGTVPVLQAQDQASTLCITSRIQPHTPGGKIRADMTLNYQYLNVLI